MALPEEILNLEEIERALNYTFKDKSLLLTAFVHCSYINEHREVYYNNERLEFLGDSILGMVIAEYLYYRFPEKPEGELSSLRSRLVEAPSCVRYLQLLNVEKFLLLGKGERLNSGRGRMTILADLFEAVIGAIYLDGGLDAIRKFIDHHLKDPIESLVNAPLGNWKAVLQDLCQKKYQATPIYKTIQTSGPEHNKSFDVAVLIKDQPIGNGSGLSKKEAHQKAALNALCNLFPETEGLPWQ